MSKGPHNDHDALVEQLTTGFTALLHLAEDLAKKNDDLERQINSVKTQFQKHTVQRDSSQSALSSSKEAIHPAAASKKFQIDASYGCPLPSRLSSDRESDPKFDILGLLERSSFLDRRQKGELGQGMQAWRTLRASRSVQSPNSSRLVSDDKGLDPNIKMQAHKYGEPPPMEQDFTTHGEQGDLKCPLASGNTIPEGHNIIGEPQILSYDRRYSLPTPSYLAKGSVVGKYRTTNFSSPPLSASGSASKCPIRFLDQQSPEKIAKYFENHKHEIPRSHEICVKRYQSNSESIRQLDAKYGSLVNMIQGLGVKHQPLLPTKEVEEEDELGRQSIEKVQKWAASCSEDGEDDEDGEEAVTQDSSADEATEQRIGHFDRPLKEIRVGESPSRPWGISVPHATIAPLSEGQMRDDQPKPDLGPVRSFESLQDHATASKASPPRSEKCPFDPKSSKVASEYFKVPGSHRTHSTRRKDHTAETRPDKSPNEKPQMVFTGPVFIGYSAEDAKNLVRECFPGIESGCLVYGKDKDLRSGGDYVEHGNWGWRCVIIHKWPSVYPH